MAKVFISYSHDSDDSDAHGTRVRALAESLIKLGQHVELDQFETHAPHGWPTWCEERLRPEHADFVLMICTADYRDGVENRVPPEKRRGVFWEAQIIRTYLYDEKANKRFLPVLFDDADGEFVPHILKPHQTFRLRSFAQTDLGYEDLYRVLTDQPAIVRPPPGPVVIMPPRPFAHIDAGSSPSAPPRYDIARINLYAPTQLIGRAAPTKIIDEAWAPTAGGGVRPRVLAFVALGGEGKTSLVAAWANALAARDWPGCEAAYAWSFYRQGASEQAGASSDLFFADALAFFGLPPIERESGYDKAKRLARHLGERRALLILDGLEPLQYPPSSPQRGVLKDEALRALLIALAAHNAGLCLVTTRYRVVDLDGLPAAPQHDLPGLEEEAGALLLTQLGVRGSENERRKLSKDVRGHPLTLEILGGYLKEAHGGDIARRDRVKLDLADAEEKNGHAFRAMAAYADWLASDGGPAGARALALLRLTGLFDQAADTGCLEALWSAPAIAGLTEPVVGLSEEQRNITLSRLEAAKLVSLRREGGALVEIDAHPLLRAYFAKQLRETQPEAWCEAHRRLYAHLTATPDKDKPSLDDLLPLYRAVAHGCAAGLWQETRDKVYFDRIHRGAETYSLHKLGAFGADLGAVACFFASPWREVSPHLTPEAQGWLLSAAGFCLRALGRLEEAREPMRAGIEMSVAQENWEGAATGADNLSELELTLGRVDAAVASGETAVTHADRSGDAFERMISRAIEADARHQAGAQTRAEALFAAAESMQAKESPDFPELTSLAGYRYCDLRLGPAERSAWRRLMAFPAPGADAALAACAEVARRATKALAWAIKNNWLLDIGLDHLSLARAALYAAALRGETPPRAHFDEAVDFLRRAGQQDYRPRPLLVRAMQRAASGAFVDARDDLDEAFEVAARGPMRLHLADVHLHRARLFGLLAQRPAYPWDSPSQDLAEARALIESCGYRRRLPELEDAEAALKALGGGR